MAPKQTEKRLSRDIVRLRGLHLDNYKQSQKINNKNKKDSIKRKVNLNIKKLGK